MIKIGEYNTLKILRDTSVGLYLGDNENNDVLLPNKYVPDAFEMGDEITVFCYLDNDERPIATTLKPYIKLNDFALLKVAEVNKIGAFLDWGLEKHLFVPFREQAGKMEKGKKYLIYMFLDEKTGRLVGSSKTNQFINNDNLTVREKEEVSLIVSRYTELGIEVIINRQHKGLIYKNEVFQKLSLGQHLKGYVNKIRSDNKIDISLQKTGYKNIEPSAQKLLEKLKNNDGFLALNDKSDPEAIKSELEMSKKNFKKALGNLYKQKLVLIKEEGIYLT
ncbi:CvfB family protein [Abyssalbus ytuae]|uniref:S1-like domain-containing RNA-binding protein n=1 Tax=Abyssalbus ytuae TaxID=2926907 RepID=A0A9E6ZT16_9FLAO|nr:S1-like domain-containing RNA-binding protein [Abyssalbus ytuae]UOB17308.1 S1-like domain-containing RNA-binding protein [Abyssalbus ytuae]